VIGQSHTNWIASRHMTQFAAANHSADEMRSNETRPDPV